MKSFSIALLLSGLLVQAIPYRLSAQAVCKADSLRLLIPYYLLKKDSTSIFNLYLEIGKAYHHAAKHVEAERYINEAIDYATLEQLPRAYNIKGGIYWHKGRYDSAMIVYRKELELAEKTGNKKLMGIALNNIGFIYAEYRQHDKTLAYYQKALNVRTEAGDTTGIALSCNSLGRVYLELDSFALALDYFDKALRNFNLLGKKRGASNALNNIGNLYMKQKDYQQAIIYHQKALKLRQEIEYYYLIAESYKNLSKAYIAIKDYQQALKTIELGIAKAKEVESKKLLSNLYLELYEIHVQQGNPQEALDAYIQHTDLKDSLFSIETNNKISELEIQYQSERSRQEIEFLSRKEKLSDRIIIKQRQNIITLAFSVSLLLLLLFLLLSFYIQRNKAYKMLVKQSIEIVQNEADNGGDLVQVVGNNNDNSLEAKKSLTQYSEDKQQIINDLLNIMEKEKYYRKKHCTIDEVAKHIKTNRQYLSQVINDYFNSNFNNFINIYRVKEARKLLANPDHDKYTIEAIGKLVGFNNRTTFAAAFKKQTGVTPSFFKKERGNFRNREA